MSSVRAALRQVKRQLVFASLLTIFLNAALIFSAFALLFVFATIPFFYAGIPMLLYLVPMSAKRIKEVKIKTVEEKVPELEWQLRTTEDTIGKENEVIDNLHQRVLAKMMQIKNSYLLDKQQLRRRGTVTCGLLALVAVFSILGVHLFDINNPGGLTGFFAKDPAQNQQLFGDTNSSTLDTKKGERDIYGEKDAAKLGDDQLELELNRQNSELDRNNLGDPQGKKFSQQSLLGDIGASTDASYKEHIDEENKKLVKNYFEKLAGVK